MNNYTDKEFYKNMKKSIDFLNMKTSYLTGTVLGLQSIKFFMRNTKINKVQSKYTLFLLIIPFFL